MTDKKPAKPAGKRPGMPGFWRRQPMVVTCDVDHDAAVCAACGAALGAAQRCRQDSAHHVYDLERSAITLQITAARHRSFVGRCTCEHFPIRLTRQWAFVRAMASTGDSTESEYALIRFPARRPLSSGAISVGTTPTIAIRAADDCGSLQVTGLNSVDGALRACRRDHKRLMALPSHNEAQPGKGRAQER